MEMQGKDATIVSAAIYPAIGIARVGNSQDEFFVGPEVIARQRKPASFYKDATGALKRQAAKFRVYGLDARGQVVKELTADSAQIKWKVQVANKKASWYEFNVAMDIPQAMPTVLRNQQVTDRKQLEITPSAVSISGKNVSGKQYAFADGKFMGTPVYLGELRTDESGCLLFLGGHGLSRSAYPDNPPTTFGNNQGWHDDTSDGPVEAEVTYNGKALPVTGAWVVTAPPNYAPDVISVLTMYDVIYDTLAGQYIDKRTKPSFKDDIYPLLHQFTDTQWVNKGFFASYGKGQAYDFEDPDLIRKLSTITPDGDQFQEYRRQIFNYFRNPNATEVDRKAWPWMYGDNMNIPNTTANGYLSVTNTLYGYLKQWVAGNFEQDWDPNAKVPQRLSDIASPQHQADMLTKSALWYCLGGPFHPGCEMTWPMRIQGMYSGPFRIRKRSANNPEPELAPVLNPTDFQDGNYFTDPLNEWWNGPGDITRYMAVPWQTDTASCRSGYEPGYDPFIPTFWAARVPNTVLSEKDYQVVMDKAASKQARLDAYNRRVVWYRILGVNYLDQIQHMIDHFGDLGVIGYAPGPGDLSEVPADLYVESKPYAPGGAPAADQVAARKSAVSDERARKMAEAEELPWDQGLVFTPNMRGGKRR